MTTRFDRVVVRRLSRAPPPLTILQTRAGTKQSLTLGGIPGCERTSKAESQKARGLYKFVVGIEMRVPSGPMTYYLQEVGDVGVIREVTTMPVKVRCLMQSRLSNDRATAMASGGNWPIAPTHVPLEATDAWNSFPRRQPAHSTTNWSSPARLSRGGRPHLQGEGLAECGKRDRVRPGREAQPLRGVVRGLPHNFGHAGIFLGARSCHRCES